MFDGKTLAGWRETAFAGRGEVHCRAGVIVLHMGDPFTGINWTNEFPKMNTKWRSTRCGLTGSDFFATYCPGRPELLQPHCGKLVRPVDPRERIAHVPEQSRRPGNALRRGPQTRFHASRPESCRRTSPANPPPRTAPEAGTRPAAKPPLPPPRAEARLALAVAPSPAVPVWLVLMRSQPATPEAPKARRTHRLKVHVAHVFSFT